jgi:hypothetical protein
MTSSLRLSESGLRTRPTEQPVAPALRPNARPFRGAFSTSRLTRFVTSIYARGAGQEAASEVRGAASNARPPIWCFGARPN